MFATRYKEHHCIFWMFSSFGGTGEGAIMQDNESKGFKEATLLSLNVNESYKMKIVKTTNYYFTINDTFYDKYTNVSFFIKFSF